MTVFQNFGEPRFLPVKLAAGQAPSAVTATSMQHGHYTMVTISSPSRMPSGTVRFGLRFSGGGGYGVQPDKREEHGAGSGGHTGQRRCC